MAPLPSRRLVVRAPRAVVWQPPCHASALTKGLAQRYLGAEWRPLAAHLGGSAGRVLQKSARQATRASWAQRRRQGMRLYIMRRAVAFGPVSSVGRRGSRVHSSLAGRRRLLGGGPAARGAGTAAQMTS